MTWRKQHPINAACNHGLQQGVCVLVFVFVCIYEEMLHFELCLHSGCLLQNLLLLCISSWRPCPMSACAL